MLNELHIKNYRLITDLNLSSIGRVNLIVGSNNSGKSSLLEAVYLLTSDNALASLFHFLQERGEYIFNQEDENALSSRLSISYNISSIFNDRHYNEDTPPLKIWSDQNNSFDITQVATQKTLFDSVDEYTNFRVKHRKNGKTSGEDTLNLSKEGYLLRAERRRLSLHSELSQFITTRQLNYSELAQLWDNISLTPSEDKVIEALQLLEPRVERIAFTGRQTSNSGIKIKLRDQQHPVPLGSMGDGMRRILGIATSLVSVEDGTLLIDEIDTGLHYSTLKDMWKLVLETAQKLNAQVFATTHSWDCVRSFQEALDDTTEEVGQLIRLDRKGQDIVPIIYSKKELDIAIEQGIEVR